MSTYEISTVENDSFSIPNPVPFLRYIVSISPIQKTIIRQYIKVQKISADIGGILKFFIIISSFLNRIFSRVAFLFFSLKKEMEKKSSQVKKKIETVVLKENNYFPKERSKKDVESSKAELNKMGKIGKVEKIGSACLGFSQLSLNEKEKGNDKERSYFYYFFKYYFSSKSMNLRVIQKYHEDVYSFEKILEYNDLIKYLFTKVNLKEIDFDFEAKRKREEKDFSVKKVNNFT